MSDIHFAGSITYLYHCASRVLTQIVLLGSINGISASSMAAPCYMLLRIATKVGGGRV